MLYFVGARTKFLKLNVKRGINKDRNDTQKEIKRILVNKQACDD